MTDNSRIARRALLVGVVFVLFSGNPLRAADPPAAGEETVRLVVEYGDGVEKSFTRLPWKKGMTALDAVVAASRHPRGIRVEYRGKGATAFLEQIDDVKNEPGGRSWIFRVNGKLADRSFGVYPLEAADTVLWRFEEYR